MDEILQCPINFYTLENSHFEPKVMEVDGSNDFPFQV